MVIMPMECCSPISKRLRALRALSMFGAEPVKIQYVLNCPRLPLLTRAVLVSIKIPLKGLEAAVQGRLPDAACAKAQCRT